MRMRKEDIVNLEFCLNLFLLSTCSKRYYSVTVTVSKWQPVLLCVLGEGYEDISPFESVIFYDSFSCVMCCSSQLSFILLLLN